MFDPGAADPIRATVLIEGVQTGVPALAAGGLEMATAVLYLIGVRRVSTRRRWPVRHTASFLTGLALIWVAVGSGLAGYDESSVTLHMVQHLLLMMMAPPLLALGRPVTLATAATGRPVQVRITRLVRGRLLSVLTHPLVAGPLYFAAMWLMLVDRGVYDFLISHETVHEASHVVLLVVGLLYWPPLVAPETSRHRLSHAARVVLLLVAMPLEAFPGLWLRFQSSPIDPINTLADTRTAGEVFMVAAVGLCSVWLVAIVSQWFAFALREEAREAHKVPAGDAWTVPWWVAPDPTATGTASES